MVEGKIADVRLWPLADFSDGRRLVCSWGSSGRRTRTTPRSAHDPLRKFSSEPMQNQPRRGETPRPT